MFILEICLSVWIEYYVSRCEHHHDPVCICFLELCKENWKLLCFSDIENGSRRDHLLFCVFEIEDLWPSKQLREVKAYFAGDFYVLWGNLLLILGCLKEIVLTRVFQTRAHGEDLAREAISSGPRRDFVSKQKFYIYEKFVNFVECNVPQQSHYLRCPALELLCNCLHGPLTRKFGDPVQNQAMTLKWLCDGCCSCVHSRCL